MTGTSLSCSAHGLCPELGTASGSACLDYGVSQGKVSYPQVVVIQGGQAQAR